MYRSLALKVNLLATELHGVKQVVLQISHMLEQTGGVKAVLSVAISYPVG